MDLNRLEFSLTEKCNSQCIYCQADAGPWRNEIMEVSDAHNYLTETVKVADLKSFLLFGGEPMLYPTRAFAIFKKTQQLSIPKIGMLTNGTCGKEKAEAKELAEKLKDSGLNVLGVSVDAFHLQFIPLEYPRNSAEAAVKAGIEQVTWNVAVLESSDGANHYDKLTNHILKQLEPLGIEAHVHKVSAAGRALRTMPQYFQKTTLDGPCEGETPMENTVRNPRSITIEPSGEVDICWHLSIGNAKESLLSWIIGNYDWRKNPMIKTLGEEGPMGLLRQYKSQVGRLEKNAYINKCHLCTEVRRTVDARA
ncbi:MAG: radical SAM protein [Candidatus Bathyarchaeia archaeon]